MPGEGSSVQPYTVGPGEAELRWMGRTNTLFLADGASTGGAFCLVDEQAPKGDEVPLHRHPADVESFYVLEGRIRFYLDDSPGVSLSSGGFVHIPAGAVHGFRIESEGARYLILTTAPHGDFYRAITVPAGPDRQPTGAKVEGPAIKAAVQSYGIEFVGPLPAD